MPCQGFGVVLQPINQKAPHNISSAIDESNIIPTKRGAHLEMGDKDWYLNVQCFQLGFQLFNQKSEAPKSYSKPIKSPNSASWKHTVSAKLSAMERLAVLKLVDIPLGVEILNNVWIFRRKFDENGALIKYKAAMCSRQFSD